jgi:hypothetical protein
MVAKCFQTISGVKPEYAKRAEVKEISESEKAIPLTRE